MSEEDKIRIEAIVKGRVKGVSFRYYTLRKAQMLNLDGWVKNLPNGNVKVVFEGDKSDAKKLLDWLKIGPSLANVSKLESEEKEYRNEFDGFDIRF
jgi:acylphosphatase